MSYLLRWLREADILICTISLLFLPWFLVLALKQPKVTVFILSTSGVILGMFLFWIWIDWIEVHYQLFPIELPEVLMWMSLPGLPIIGGLIGFFLARKYTMYNELPLSA